MKRLILTAILTTFLGLSVQVIGSSFHAATNGKSSGNGSIENPWDLKTALKKSTIKPGDTLWIHPGTYLGVYKSTLNGNANAPIIVKAISDFEVILDGNVTSNDAVFSIEGTFVWYIGLTITNSNPNRIEGMPNLSTRDGVYFIGANNKLINCIIHNNGGCGIGFWKPAINAEIYGCIVYHNGYRGTTRGHGHGIYLQNQTGTKLITDNIFFNSFGIGIHAYSEGYENKGFKIEGNTFFNSGLPGADFLERHIIAGGLKPVDDVVVNENYFYNKPNYASKAGVQFGYSSANSKAEFTNNYVVESSFYNIKNWNSVTFTGNSMVSSTKQMQLIAFDSFFNINNPNFNNNQYYKGNLGLLTFQEWKNATNQDGSSTYSSSVPTSTTYFIRKNQFEAGRANLIVYNWGNQKNVDIDFSEVLSVGYEYEIYDVSCLSCGPISFGIYDGSPISVSMELTDIELPNGQLPNLNEFVHTAPLFGVFIIKCLNLADNSQSTEIETNTPDLDFQLLNIENIYPNPVVNNMTVSINSHETSIVEMNIVDLMGRTVYSENIFINRGLNEHQCNLSSLKQGVYVVNISNGSNKTSAKITKI